MELDGEDLSGVERRVWEAFPRGQRVDLRVANASRDTPERGGDSDRVVRAHVVAALLLGAHPAEPGHVARLALAGARVVGRLELDDAEIRHPIDLTGCVFDEPISLAGARTRRVDLSGSHLPGLNARQARVDGDMGLRECVVDGGVQLGGAYLAGMLELHGAHLIRPDEYALDAPRLTIDHSIYCADGFVSEGGVRLVGSTIKGGLHMSGVRLSNSGADALEASRVTIGDNLNLIDGCVIEGHVRTIRTWIKGGANLSGAVLRRAGGPAWTAHNLTVEHNLFCGNGFAADGEIRMLGARVAGDFVLQGARLSNPDGFALDAGSLTVQRGMQCDQGFVARGHIRLIGANLGVLSWLPTQDEPSVVDLRHARVGVLFDASSASPARVRLDGLVYDTLDPLLSVRERLAWLERQQEAYLPQPYEQLASAYRRLGHDADARRVLLAKQRRRRATLTVLGRAWGLLQDWTVGYGYLPGRAAAWLLALLTVGTAVFWTHPPVQVHSGPRFDPLLYTADLLVPIINLGQQNAFVPASGPAQWLADALVAAGWILATTVTTGITRSLART